MNRRTFTFTQKLLFKYAGAVAKLTTSDMNWSCKLSSTNSRPAAMQFSPLLKNTPLHAYHNITPSSMRISTELEWYVHTVSSWLQITAEQRHSQDIVLGADPTCKVQGSVTCHNHVLRCLHRYLTKKQFFPKTTQCLNSSNIMRYFFNPGSTDASDHKVAYSWWWSCDKLKKIKTVSEKYRCKISQFWKSATAVLTVVFQSALHLLVTQDNRCHSRHPNNSVKAMKEDQRTDNRQAGLTFLHLPSGSSDVAPFSTALQGP